MLRFFYCAQCIVVCILLCDIAISLSRSVFIAVLFRFVVLSPFYLYHSLFLTSAKNAFVPRSVCCAQMTNKLLWLLTLSCYMGHWWGAKWTDCAESLNEVVTLGEGAKWTGCSRQESVNMYWDRVAKWTDYAGTERLHRLGKLGLRLNGEMILGWTA